MTKSETAASRAAGPVDHAHPEAAVGPAEAGRPTRVAADTLTGGCACGGTRWRVEAGTAMAALVACHCRQCNQMSSHLLAATSVAETGLTWTREETLTWYQSSDFAERGFCRACGCNISWRLSDTEARETVALMAGSFDDQSGLRLERHIFVDHKPAYCEITDGLPQFPDSD